MRRIVTWGGLGAVAVVLASWVALAMAEPPPALPTPPPLPPAPASIPPLPMELPQAPAPASLPPAPEPELPMPTAPIPASEVRPAPDLLPVPLPPMRISTLVPPPAAPKSEAPPPKVVPHVVSAPETAPMGPSGLPPAGPQGRQEPAVSLEWIGPATAKIGQPADFALVVRNTGNVNVHQVTVRARVPAGMTLAAAEPTAKAEKECLTWDLGVLAPRQEKNLQMKLVADVHGDVMPQAWVTFTGSASTLVKIRQPRLALKLLAPEKVLVGESVPLTLTVSNPGDGAAELVRVKALLSPGLEHPRGAKVDFDIGNLAAGETRSVQLVCNARAGGAQKVEVSAEGDGLQRLTESAAMIVVVPRLDLQLAGPGLRYVERKALYTLKVTNPGDALATNVTISDVVPAGFRVLAASDGGRLDASTRTVSWSVGDLGPGNSREVKLEVMAINPGEHKHHVAAEGARGLHAEADLATRVEGVSALLMEVVDTEDPIEVNGDTAYEIRITNTGSKAETDIKVVATIPDKMEFNGARASVRYREEGKQIIFEPIARLAPRADVIFRINVKASEAGHVRFKVQMTSASLIDPVIKMEATHIYADTQEPKPGK